MTDEERLEEIKKRTATASDGPWGFYHDECGMGFFRIVDDAEEPFTQSIILCNETDERTWNQSNADASFLTAAREDIPWLLDHIDALEQEHDGLRAALNEVAKILRQSRGQNAMRLFTSVAEAVDCALAVLARTDAPLSSGGGSQ